jgi:MFS family permease
MSSPSPSDNEHPAVGRSDAVASFPALRHRDFRLLWLGQLISVTGSQMQLLAINWHVYLLTKSPLALGGVGLVRVVPIVACSLVGGVVADAVDRKRLILVSQSVMLISAALLALMTATGIVTVWPIYVLTAIGSAAVAFDNPARQALLPKLVPAEDFPNAVSLGLVVFNSAMIVGPSIGGLLLRSHGPALIYALNAVSFLAVIVAVIMIRASGKPLVAQDSSAERGSSISFSAFQDGLRFVRHAPIIVQTMTLDFVATFFASATALLPIFADRILRVGPQGLGLLDHHWTGVGQTEFTQKTRKDRPGSGRRVRSFDRGIRSFSILLFIVANARIVRCGRHRKHRSATNNPAAGYTRLSARTDDFGEHDLLHGRPATGRV